jgi:hemoglobin
VERKLAFKGERLMLNRLTLAAAALVAALSLGACATASMQSQTLYQRLGGKDAIVAVVDDFVGNVAGDARINRRFAATNIPHLKQMLVDQICTGTGGPCTYSGRDMKSAHAGMNISDAEFGALVEDLVKTLDKFKVPDKEKNDLLAILGPMKTDIVGR